MKNTFYLAFFAFFIFSACNSNPLSESSSLLTEVENTAAMPFTDTLKVDSFKVIMKGTTLKNSVLLFTIKSYNGKEIYKASIKSTDIVITNSAIKTEADQIKYLQNEVKYFFDEEHFLMPAVIPTEKADQNVPDKVFYEELKQTKLNGFSYRIGKEAKIYIAWSVKEQKVKVYYKCC
jgi:hypothetical protein